MSSNIIIIVTVITTLNSLMLIRFNIYYFFKSDNCYIVLYQPAMHVNSNTENSLTIIFLYTDRSLDTLENLQSCCKVWEQLFWK